MTSMQGSNLLIQEIKYWQGTTMILKCGFREIVKAAGPVSYKVHIDKDGRIFQDQLRKGCIVNEKFRN